MTNFYEGFFYTLATLLVGAGFLVSCYGIWYLKAWGYFLAQIVTLTNCILIFSWPILYVYLPSVFSEAETSFLTFVSQTLIAAGIMGFLYYKRELFNV
ncbi:MAG: hypothetical protein ACFE9L_16140 [Candidatus Hodarchaeota archaeon]